MALDADKNEAKSLPEDTGVKFPVVFDPQGKIAGAYGVGATPFNVAIDKNGKVVEVLEMGGEDELRAAIRKAMGASNQ